MDIRKIAVASLILGGVGVLLTIVFRNTLPWPGLIVSIAGLVLSVKSNKIEKTAFANAGFALSLIGILGSIIVFVFHLVSAAFSAADTLGVMGALAEFI